MKYEDVEAVVAMCREFPAFVKAPGDLFELFSLAGKAHRLFEAACTYDLTKIQERNLARVKERVETILPEAGYTGKIRFNGDPRGYAIRINVPSGRSNNWGGEDWGI